MKIAVVGMGYVGLPLAAAFSQHYPVIGFDINAKKINLLKKGIDYTGEVHNISLSSSKELTFTNIPTELKTADFIIVAVPTPVIEETKKPDLSCVESASKVVGENLKKNAIVVYESTVYPGVTENICVPIIEKYSGLKCGKYWKIGYSPERINPGDKVNTVRTITKIVSGMDNESLYKIAEVYSKICPICRVRSIMIAEAVKAVENAQRDVNIAFMNEISLVLGQLGIDTNEVIDAASTKWNFHKYQPGLVGGHCIGVDPYYLIDMSLAKGHIPELMVASRKINESIALHLSKRLTEILEKTNKKLNKCSILIMGLTFKENVADIRNSKIKDLIEYLKLRGIDIVGCDPLIDKETAKKEFGIDNFSFAKLPTKFDAIVIAQAHNSFKTIGLDNLKSKTKNMPILVDIKRVYNKQEALDKGFIYQHI